MAADCDEGKPNIAGVAALAPASGGARNPNMGGFGDVVSFAMSSEALGAAAPKGDGDPNRLGAPADAEV